MSGLLASARRTLHRGDDTTGPRCGTGMDGWATLRTADPEQAVRMGLRPCAACFPDREELIATRREADGAIRTDGGTAAGGTDRPEVDVTLGKSRFRANSPDRATTVLYLVSQLDLHPSEVRAARHRLGMDDRSIDADSDRDGGRS